MYFRMLFDESSVMVSYLLADLDACAAVLIDPRSADLPVLSAMLDEHRLCLQWVLRTHEHDQHCPGEGQALAALGAPVIQHRLPAPGPDWLVFGNEHLRVLGTPGHTRNCLSFLWRDRLFCGGLLAVDGCACQPRPAAPEALWDSVMHKVFALPSETLLFSGHVRCGRAVSNVHEQRRWHPWFAGASRDDFLARASAPALLPSATDPQGTDALPYSIQIPGTAAGGY